MRFAYITFVLLGMECLGHTTEKLDIVTGETSQNFENVETIQIQKLNMEPPVRSITDLVLQQTETIKKLIAEQQKNHSQEIYKETEEVDTIEDLKKKCEHLSKLFNISPASQEIKDQNPRNDNNNVLNLDLLQFKPKFPSPTANLQKAPTMAGNYFIFTQNPEIYGNHKLSDKMDTAASNVEEDVVSPPSEEEQLDDEDYENETTSQETTSKPVEITISTITPTAASVTVPSTTITTTSLPLPKFKYVRLEPIVLKQIALPNGKITRQWYRLLPATQSFVQIADTLDNQEVNVVAQPQQYDASVSLPDQYKLYVDPQTGLIKANAQLLDSTTTTTIATTTTTTERPQVPVQQQRLPQFFINPQTGMIYQSALPNQFIYHNRSPITPPTSTFTTTSTTTTTTEKVPDLTYTINIPHKPEEESKPVEGAKKQFKHEFRFVIPMVVQGTQDEISKYPYQIDPYAYLPKDQRPETMNIPVPYVPNYQMIRKLMMPNTAKVNEE